MYYSALGFLAILILLIENQDILFHRSSAFDKPAWKLYRRFLFAVLVYDITDVLWGILESRKMALLLFADTSVYFVAMAVGVLLWTEYAVVYLEGKNSAGRLLLTAGRTIAVLITLFVLLNLFFPVLFTVDTNAVYRALSIRYALLTFQMLMFLLVSVYAVTAILRHRSSEEQERRYRTMALFGLIMAVFLFVQVWLPLLPMYATGYMLGTCLLRAFVIGDEKESDRRGLEEANRVRELTDTISSLLNNMPGMTFTKDAKSGVYLACNQAFAKYAHKASPEEVLGLCDAQLFDGETANRFVEDDRMALSMDRPYIFFEDVSDALGNQRQLQTTKLKYTDVSGRECVLSMCQDVTDLVRIRREAATTRDAYEKVRSAGIVYTRIAQALAQSYTDLYYVNLDTEEFIEYLPDKDSGVLTEARRGWHFFAECRMDIRCHVHPEDQDALLRALARDSLTDTLARNGRLIKTYRLVTETGPTYVNMTVTRMEDDERFIILGVTDVNEEMLQRRAAERMKEERIAYQRLSALTGDLLCVYVVDLESGRYREYSASTEFKRFGLSQDGQDFFADTRERCRRYIYPEDLERFLSLFNREAVLSEVEHEGIFAISYRLMIDGKPTYVRLKAAMTKEKEGTRLIVGLIDIDSHVRQEAEYERRLAQAQRVARIDALTGVKNKHAYLDAEERLDRQISQDQAPEFAVVILDVNNLKLVNDTAGHQAGDQCIRDACKVVCNIFQHSPVFRVGGDEFAVISQGRDYERIEELVEKMREYNAEALRSGGVVVACGMAKYRGDESVAPVFERADHRMYENKCFLKSGEAS